MFIGAWIRFSDWTNAAIDLTPGLLAAFFFSILFIRRIPALMLLYKTVPDIHTWQEALFCGWFGPMGVVSSFRLTRMCGILVDSSNNTRALSSFRHWL
jgi:NhaP-type Na+/H+ or K+/H+ antiporter